MKTESKNKKKILFQFGVRILLLLAISVVIMVPIVFICEFLLFHSAQFTMVEKAFTEFDEHIENHPHIESVMNFWKDHPEEIAGGLSESEAQNANHISDMFSEIDDSRFHSLTYSEQKILACSDYMELSQIFKNYVKVFGYKELLCMDITEENFGMIYFYEKKDEKNNDTALGMKADYQNLNLAELGKIQSGKNETYATIKNLDDGTKVYIVYEGVEINGQPKCVNICVYDWTESDMFFKRALKLSFRGLLVLMAFIMAVSVAYLYFSTLRPILKIQKYVHSYMDSMNTEKFLTGMDTVRRGNEIGTLSGDLSDMIKKIEEYHAEILQNTKEKAKTEYELSIASKMQAAMLPQKLPEAEGYSVAASMNPAAYVGGDFYDSFMTDESHLVLVIADVTGKGVYAALLAASVQTSLRCNARPDSRPSELLTRLNKEILEKNLDKMFVTVWIGILDTKTGILTTSNAGHEYPMLNADGVYEKYKDKHGLPAGARLKSVYTDCEIHLTKGSSLFVYTDGVTEAVIKDGERFGTDRLTAVLNENPDMLPDEILSIVKHSVSDYFAEGTEQFDDITMMCIRCLNTV